ncbi:MAG: hypothetical protein HC837_19365 [Chloroflexaceae bacterium]|nr:hypothetical protein [Chloroflexaceae bacterium]
MRFDYRTALIMAGATLLGAAWAFYNYLSTDGERGQAQLQPLVWVMFATPFALFLGWLIARRSEVWLAAFVCFCLYFFTYFVAARFESLFFDTGEARRNGHALYFQTAMAIHVLAGLAITGWRAMRPPWQHERRSVEALERTS